jgi:hypothetical protein
MDVGGPVSDGGTVHSSISVVDCVDFVDARESADKRVVIMTDGGFSPRCLAVKAGQSIDFQGDTTKHLPWSNDAAGPFSSYLFTKDSATVFFDTADYFPYQDKFGSGLTGVIWAL